jgi:hypothetical protein
MAVKYTNMALKLMMVSRYYRVQQMVDSYMTFVLRDKAVYPQRHSGPGCMWSAERPMGDRDEYGDSAAVSGGSYGRSRPKNKCTL